MVESGSVLERSPLALAVSLVTPSKDEGGDAEAKQHGELASNGGPDTRHISWVVRLAEDGCGEDTTNTSGSNDDTSGDGTLGVASNVVGAVGENSWNAARGTGIDEEKAKVSSTMVVRIASDEETDENNNVLHSKPDSTLFSPIRNGSEDEGTDGGEEVGRAGQCERCQGAVTHTLEDDGDEETDGIGGHGR